MNLLLQSSSSSRSDLLVLDVEDFAFTPDVYFPLEILETVLTELFKLSALLSFANLLLILSSWSILVSKLSVT